jgi:hypothetical protein
MIRSIIRAGFVALLAAATVAVAQTEFSADIVQNDKADKAPTKVYFSKDKVRFDSVGGGSRGGGGSVIMDLSTGSFTVLMPERHMYMEMPAGMMENRGVFRFFRSGDVDDACADWLKMDQNKGGTCHKVGHETVNGRSTVKYEGTNAQGESAAAWFDSKLRFPVKWEGKNGGGEMRNIQEGSQPASQFEIPAGYNKMDMGAMMKQHQ